MNANRQKKANEIAALKTTFDQSETVVVAHYSGLSVAQMTDLRNKLRAEGASFKVTKNTLTKLALKGSRFEAISDLFEGPTGVAVSNDPVAAAKVVHEFAKKNTKLVIVGGAMGETVLDANGVEQLAKMPSLDELRGKIVGILQAPATKVARVLQAPAQQLVGVTKAYGETN